MDHKAHEKAEIDCVVCHNRVTHLGATKYEPLRSNWEEATDFKYEDFLTMRQGCFRCHGKHDTARSEETLALIKNGKIPPRACTTCHTKQFDFPRGHLKSSWRSEHKHEAKKDFGYCVTCHGAGAKFDNDGTSWCIRCHGSGQAATFK